MIDSLKNLEWANVAASLAERCASSLAAIRAGELAPLSRNEIIRRHLIINDVRDEILTGNRPHLAGISDIGDPVARATLGGVLDLEELSAIKTFTRTVADMEKYLKALDDSRDALKNLAGEILDHSSLTSRLGNAIADDGTLSKKTFPVLARLEKKIQESKRDLEKSVSSFLNSPGNDVILQEKIQTSRNGRAVVLIKAGMKGRVSGTVHDISSSGQTLYFEPAAVMEQNSRLIMLQQELQHEIFLILKDLSGLAGGFAAELSANLEVMVFIDLMTASARLSLDMKGAAPEISADPVIDLQKARHPVLALTLGDAAVPNDIALTLTSRAVIISGANTGGKTVLLKTIGLLVLMASRGLHVPAGDGSVIGLFDEVIADIGDDQDLAQSLSSFSGQVVIIRDTILRATGKSLVLIDEIMAGTAPRQGAALARAALETMAAKGAALVVTTHYPELKELAVEDGRFVNASVSFDIERLTPTYRLHVGIPGVSYALEIASLYGIPRTVIKRAEELIDDTTRSLEQLAEDIHRQQRELEEKHHALMKLEEDLLHEKEAVIESGKKLQEERLKITARQGLDMIEELQRYQERLAKRVQDIQALSMKEASAVSRDITVTRLEIEKKVRKARLDGSKGRPLKLEDPAGSTVYLPSLDREGVVISFNEKKKTAEVRIGATLTSRFNVDDLRFLAQPVIEAPKKQTHAAPVTLAPRAELTIQTSSNTIDLRGLRVDEGLVTMEKELDRMSRSAIGTAIVIHGHGTGAMKEAVRKQLSSSFYASSFRSGRDGEGGDGVTIVILD